METKRYELIETRYDLLNTNQRGSNEVWSRQALRVIH